jgi:tetratricopeptide (TPR) repeat protein
MSDESPSDEDVGVILQPTGPASVHIELSGNATARDVAQIGYAGTVHVHSPASPGVRVPAQLPPAAGGFVDRREETIRFHAIVGADPEPDRPPVALISGMRGVGKTAAVRRWAHELKSGYVDGQLHVNLGELARRDAVETADVLRLFLRALGVNVDLEADDIVLLEGLTGLYRDRTSGRRLLIVLEDVPYSANLGPLIPASADSAVIITSSHRLKGPLFDGAELLTLRPLADDDGIDLLARMVGRPRLGADIDATRQIVRYCGGLPFALRMIGARLQAHPGLRPSDVARAMADERKLLRMLADNDRALETAFSVAYDGLPDDTRPLYRWLGLNPGLDISAAIVVEATGIPLETVERHLEILVASNLLDDTEDGERYRCHELVWPHAKRRAEIVDGQVACEKTFDRLAQAYLRLAVYADHAVMGPRLRLADHPWFDPEKSPFTSAAQALDWLETYRRNLLGLIREAANREWDRFVWWMCEPMWVLYLNRKHYGDWKESHQLAVRATVRLGDAAAEARMRSQLARAQMEERRYGEALDQLALAAAAAARSGNRRVEASVQEFTGRTLIDQGTDPAAGEAALAAAVAINIEVGNRRGAAIAMHHLARAQARRGQLDDAVSVLRQALTICEEHKDDHNEARVLISLGEALRDQGQYVEAARALDRSMDIMRRREVPFQIAQALEALAELCHRTGDAVSEQRHLREALKIYEDLGSPRTDRIREKIGSAGT